MVYPSITISASALFFLFVLYWIIKSAYLVKQSEVVIVERLGRFHKVLVSGFHVLVPVIDRPRKVVWTYVIESPSGRSVPLKRETERIDLREQIYDFPKQNVITRDNVTIEINAVIYYQITDAKRAVYEVSDLPQAIEKLTQTTLRNIIGSLDLDEVLISRDQINDKLQVILDEATDKWGVKVNRVELQEVNPPPEIREAMEKQMRAERNKRAMILEAEGHKRSAILKAEGDRDSKIARAEGEAAAKIQVAKAEAEAIELVKKAAGGDPLPYMIALNYLKTLPQLTAGDNSKLVVIPYDAASLSSMTSIISQLSRETKP